MIPLSLYIHWPWCLKKCPYCDFNSHACSPALLEEKDYLEVLLQTLKAQKDFADGRRLISVFFGGGTPSLMSPKSISTILEAADEVYGLEENAEVTLEANPGTFEERKFKDFRSSGINRLSIGIQSFSDEKLKRLGRVHNSEEAKRAAQSAGEIFDNFNLDLMFGLPHQSIDDMREDLARALSFKPTHLSYYQLTIEPSTYFATHTPQDLPDEDTLAVMGEEIEKTLKNALFDHYEVSGYAKEGSYCRHNLNYWQYGDYLALGPGAHGKTTLDKTICRFVNYRDPALWIKKNRENPGAFSKKIQVPQEDIPFEFMLNALRLRQGVPVDFWTHRTHLPLSFIEPVWADLQAQGLVKPLSEGRLVTTSKGWQFLNEVQEAFI